MTERLRPGVTFSVISDQRVLIDRAPVIPDRYLVTGPRRMGRSLVVRSAFPRSAFEMTLCAGAESCDWTRRRPRPRRPSDVDCQDPCPVPFAHDPEGELPDRSDGVVDRGTPLLICHA